MTGLEILIAVIATIWVLKNAAVDTAFAVRGKVSPRLAERKADSQGRYRARDYFADSLSDFWKGVRARREARQAGLNPPPRQQGWLGRTYGRLRGRVTSWWDNATTRVDNRRQAEAIRGEERRPASRWQRFTDRLMGRDAAAWPAYRRRPGEDFTGRKRRRRDDPGPPPNHPGPPVYYDLPDTRVPNGNGQASNPVDVSRARGAGATNQKEQNMANGTNGEVTGLNTAINYAGDQRNANQAAVQSWEQFTASLAAGGVNGAPLAAAAQAAEAQQVAANAASAAHEALSNHTQVAEAYQANPDAGERSFVTSE